MAGKLTDAKVRSLKYDEACGKACQMYSDGGGLSLKLTKSGGKLWIVSYRFDGKQVHFHIGKYPVLSLSMARERLIECKRLLEQGVNPADKRREEKQATKEEELADKTTLGFVAEDWLTRKLIGLRNSTKGKYRRVLELDVFPKLKDRPITKIAKLELSELVRNVYARASSRGHQLAIVLRQVFRHAEDMGYVEVSIAESLPRAFPYHREKHMPAITEKEGVADMLRKIEEYCESSEVSPQMKMAMRLVPFLALRTSALCSLQWADIDLENGIVTIVAREGNKVKSDRLVYLPERTLAAFKQYAELGLDNVYCFPATKASENPWISQSGFRWDMRQSGIDSKKHSVHGWRQVLKTLASEAGVPSLLSEKALSHKVGSELEQTYNRASYEQGLRKFWQWYEDTLYALKDGKELPTWSGEKFI